MDTTQWAQGIGVVKPMESSSKPMIERKARPQKDQNVNCPRCNSTNTKFCYYNNYSLTQPRYFCKTCRRYWTEGGSLRNVPVGGGSRKNKRSAPSSSSSSKKIHDMTSQNYLTHNPRNMHEGVQDLNLAYPPSSTTTDLHQHDLNSITKLVEVPFSPSDNMNNSKVQDVFSSVASSSNHQMSALDIFKTSGVASTSTTRGLSSFMTMPDSDSNTFYSAGLPMPEFKPSLNFSLDGLDNGYGSLHGVHENYAARLLFPVEDLKAGPSSTEGDEQDRGQGESNGFWNGVLGGGSW